jgi:signal transduction histidine kinase
MSKRLCEASRSKVFEPFFRTKDVGKETDLGLRIVHRIVRETHHGKIEIDSKPGETRFRICLPGSTGPPER